MKKIWAILLMNILIINFNSFMVEAAVGNAQVTSGYGSAAVVTEDGTLYFIGKNITGSTWGGGAPVCYETPVAVSGGTNVKRVDLGYEHGVVLKTDGRVYSWGRNRNYQLGTGGGTTSYSPGLTSVRGGETGATYLTGIKDVAAGSNFSVALKEDGTVFAWGNNDSGQLGDGTKISRSTPVKVRGGETGDTYLTGVKEISADGSRVIVLKEDGSVYSWGYNTWKGVGDGTNTDRTTPVRVKGGDAGGTYLSNVKRVIVSGERSVALLNNGTTYWWGMGKYQSVGGGGGGSAGPSVPTKIRATNTGNTHFTNVEKIEAQGYQVIFRKTDGTIYGMGLNGYGQLGIGATSAVTEPIRLEAGESGVGYLDSFVSMGASESDMYLLLNDGYVYAAGRNQYGSHGTGGRVATASLVKVHGGAAGGTYLRLFNPNAAPTAPTVTAPTNGIKTSDNTVTVNWNFNDPDSGDTQSKYRVQGSTNNFSTIHYESGTISSSAKTITTTALADGNWKFRIMTWDSKNVASPWSSHRSFMVDTTAPTLTYGYTSGARYVNGKDYWVRTNDTINFWVQGVDTLAGTRRVFLLAREGSSNSYRLHYNNNTGQNYNNHDKFSFQNSIQNISNATTLKATFPINIKAGNGVVAEIEAISDDLASPHNRTGGTWVDNGLRLKVDGEIPTGPTINVDSSWQNTNVNFTVTGGSDTGSGVARREYKIGSGAWTTYSSAVTVSTEGITTVYARTVDNVGHVSAQVSREVKIDKTKPTATFTPNNKADWTKEIIGVTYTPSDNLSGVKVYKEAYSYNGGSTYSGWYPEETGVSSSTLSAEGHRKIKIYIEDNAGNSNIVYSGDYYVDTTVPTYVSSSIVGARYTNGNDYWVRPGDSAQFKLRANDNLSGPKNMYVVIDSLDANAAVHDLYGAVGNNNEWYTSALTSLTNPVRSYSSGNIKEVTWTLTGKAEMPLQNMKYYFSDRADNGISKTTLPLRFGVDNTKPTVPTINVDSSWQNTNVNFTITGGTDSGSGLARREYKIGSGAWQAYSSAVTVSAEGITTVYARTVDNVGNISAQVSREVKIDKTKPTDPVISVNQNWSNTDENFTVTSGIDALSGVLNTEYRIEGQDDWTLYSAPVTISKQNVTKIFLRTTDNARNVSETSMFMKNDDGFESDLDPSFWKWASVDENLTTMVRDNVVKKNGAYSLKMTNTHSIAQDVCVTNNIKPDNGVLVSSGDIYKVSYWVKGQSGKRSYFRIWWYDGSYTAINKISEVVKDLSSNEWTRVEALITVPAGARKMGFDLFQLATEPGASFYIDDLNVSKVMAETKIDKGMPTSISVDTIAVDMNGYEVELKGALDSMSGINRVQFPSWTSANGQDDLLVDWNTNPLVRGTDMGSGTYRFRVDIADHGNERGQYYTHIYIYDNAGNKYFAGGATPYVNSEPVVTMSTDKAAYLKGETGKLNISISDVDVADTIDYSLSAGVYAVMLGRTSGVGKGSVEIDIDTSKFDINEFVWNGTRYEKDVQIDLSVTDHKGGLVNKAVTIKIYNNKPVVTQDTPLSKLKPFTHMDISGKVLDDSGETLIGKYFFYSPLDSSKKTAERFIKGFVSTGQEGYFDARIDYDKAYLDTIKDYLGGRDSEELTDVNLRLIVRDSNGGEGYSDKLMKVKYNIVPDITVTDNLVYKKEGEVLSLSGTIIDADMDNMIIKGTIGGVEKTNTRVGAGAYTLSWNTSELLEGTYTGFKISVDDQMGGSDDVTYTSNIVVDKTKPIGSFTPNSQGTWGKV
ncbi:MAG: GBS Bsp-like repeat-containing protein, partial [Clostridia bacterium]|nr:GBS Bsp-like repeat-containing protein [Clostridia bacterium]